MTISEGAPADRWADRRDRRGGCLRAQEAGRHRRAHRRPDQEAHRREHHLPAARLPDALGRARLAGPHGGVELCEPGDRPDRAGPLGPHGRPARRQVHPHPAQHGHLRHQAGGCRRAVRQASTTGPRSRTCSASRCSCTRDIEPLQITRISTTCPNPYVDSQIDSQIVGNRANCSGPACLPALSAICQPKCLQHLAANAIIHPVVRSHSPLQVKL